MNPDYEQTHLQDKSTQPLLSKPQTNSDNMEMGQAHNPGARQRTWTPHMEGTHSDGTFSIHRVNYSIDKVYYSHYGSLQKGTKWVD